MNQTNILLETGTNEFEILEFYLDEQKSGSNESEKLYFGMNVAKVVEVIESPKFDDNNYAANPCFLGTIPLRDLILPVIDLSIWLGITREKHDHENIIVTQFSNSVQGFLVSGVVEIHRLNWSDLIPPGKYMKQLNTRSIVGMVDKGDHFIQQLDLEHIVSDLNPESTEKQWKTSVISPKAYRALVVDDSPTIRKMLEKNLTYSNFQVTIKNDGQEAINYLESLKKELTSEKKALHELIDIIICDIEMPLLDGFTLTKKVKTDGILKSIPVILYSSIITNELRHKGESVGADFQISKPDINKMAETAIQLLADRSI